MSLNSPLGKTNPQQGFTLTEALIAIAILASIAASMGPALQGAFKIAGRIHGQAIQLEENRVLTSVIQKALEGIVRIPADDNAVLFKGSSNQFQVFSYGFNRAEPDEVFVSIKRNENNDDLLLRYGEQDQPVQLLAASEFKFSYYGAINNRAPLQWHQSWKSKTLPRLVRLVARSNNNNLDLKFDFSIPSEAPLTCQFDPVSRRCRYI